MSGASSLPNDVDADAEVDPELEAAVETVHDTLERLEGDYDPSDPDDLERLRQNLPTDPQAARLLSKALPSPLRETFEYVEASERQDAYWRCSRERQDMAELSNAELRQRVAFTKANIEQRGTEGLTRTSDGRYVTRATVNAGEQIRGRDFHDPDDPPTQSERRRGRRLLDRVKKVLSR